MNASKRLGADEVVVCLPRRSPTQPVPLPVMLGNAVAEAERLLYEGLVSEPAAVAALAYIAVQGGRSLDMFEGGWR